jgi:TonB family protein
MEYAEENLSQVDRPLTTEEATDMLEGALPALAYLHGKQFAHGHLKPSNILAIDDRLKLSSDTIRPTGEWSRNLDAQDRYGPPEILVEGASSAGDVWSLGITLVDALTKHPPSWEPGAFRPSLPDDLPARFHDPVSNCLRPDSRQRWTAKDFADFLHGKVQAPPSSPNKPSRAPMAQRRYLLLAGAIVLALAAIAVVPRFMNHRVAPAPVPAPVTVQPETVAPPAAAPDPPPEVATPKLPRSAAGQAILKQVLPDVPAKARNTISGKVRINVRVGVDANGSVVDARNESPGSSRFFGNLALEAARRWKFAPADVSPSAHSREWTLRFEFVRDPRRPVSVQAAPVR